MPIKQTARGFVTMIAAAMLFTSRPALGQSTAGWLTYTGTYFSFNYPPDWSISASSATNVQLMNGDVGFSVTYTTNFGNDINRALTALETGTQQFAEAHGYTLAPEPFIPGTDSGNVSVLLHMTGSGLQPIDVWAEARLITGAISLTELVGSPDDVFTDEVTVAWPLSRSVVSLAGLTVVGSWSASVPGVGEQEQYQVALNFNPNGTYTYDVEQTDTPAWRLQVSGTYTSAPAGENDDKYPLTLQLTPVNVTPTSISNMQNEMSQLADSGLPVANGGNNQFLANLDSDGSLELVRPGKPPVRFQKAAATSNGPYRFFPITPCRVVDTRKAGGPLGPNSTQQYRLVNTCNIPMGAAAFSLNVTAVPNGDLSYLTVWPTGQTQPVASTLNDRDGRTKAVAAIVPAGTNGAISIYNETGSTNVVLDLDGYFIPAGGSGGLDFYPMAPCRIADTRSHNSVASLGTPSLTANSARDFPILLSGCGIPSTAQAYSLNFTAVPHGPLAYLTVYPAGQEQPVVSTLNDGAAQTIANAAIVPAGTNGDISVYATDETDLAIDINGYFAPPASGGLSFYTTTPCRVLDTRQTGSQPFLHELSVNVTASACAPPSNAQALVFNATVVPSAGFGYLTLWPDGSPQPLVSTLNALDGSVTNNMAMVPTSNGSIDAFASSQTHLILDLFGYFAP